MRNNQLGVYVAGVVQDGPADNAGIIGAVDGSGDIVVAVDDRPVSSFEEMVGYLVTETSPEQRITMTILRSGEEIDVGVILGSR